MPTRYELLSWTLRAYAPHSIYLPIKHMRRVTRAFFRETGVMASTEMTRVDAGGVPGAWFRRDDVRDDAVVFYLHGGGYVIGSIDTHRDLICRLTRASGVTGFAIDYRLAPEHPFPAQLVDAVAAYRWLLEQGIAPERIVMGGESAGGGLTLSTLVSLRDEGLPLPAAAFLISPWLDLEANSQSMKDNAKTDYINRRVVRFYARQFVRSAAERRSPLAAPIHADLHGLPPILIHVGGAEVLLDDSRRIAERLTEAGVENELIIFGNMIHAWHAFSSMIPEGRRAIEAIGTFVRASIPALL